MIIHIDRVLLTSAESKHFLLTWELYYFNIRGTLIVGAALSAITSLIHIFFEGRLTGQVYANFLQNVLPQLLNCSVFKTSDEWDFWRKVDSTRRPCSLATSFARPNITSVLFMGFCQRTRNGGNTYHTWRHKKKRIRRACTEITQQMLAEVRRSFHQRINKCLQVEGHHFEHLL